MNFLIGNLKTGIYTLYIQLPAPNQPYPAQVRVQSGNEAKVDLNFKDIAANQGKEYQEAAKKNEEAKAKFEGMKAHFTAGNTFLDQEKAAKADLQ